MKYEPTNIIDHIHIIRGEKVILDKDLADMYGVETKQLKRQVKRNIERFPVDFMFVLTPKEYQALRCQIGTLKPGEHSKYLPMAFTEQGIAMLSSVLSSEQAIAVNIQIVRVFIQMRKAIFENKGLMLQIEKLERRMLHQDGKLAAVEAEIKLIFHALKQLLQSEQTPRRKIGFENSKK